MTSALTRLLRQLADTARQAAGATNKTLEEGLEPSTSWLTAKRSTFELLQSFIGTTVYPVTAKLFYGELPQNFIDKSNFKTPLLRGLTSFY